jgi:hypothetical protein
VHVAKAPAALRIRSFVLGQCQQQYKELLFKCGVQEVAVDGGVVLLAAELEFQAVVAHLCNLLLRWLPEKLTVYVLAVAALDKLMVVKDVAVTVVVFVV